ncbi:60S ribosomal protein L4 [Tripterygium wilfordii]|uniref:60S ribosomal protein L4 n=1 Tax=Tripterygium wilfordii TaxID=458696 RepID=A0A7J7C5B7_TRIWF|nr:60S ribosomal protein L4 [Tripterygium wilfordii]
MKSTIRPDIVNFVHSKISKNKRQPYAVSERAGHQTSAESWGIDRVVSTLMYSSCFWRWYPQRAAIKVLKQISPSLILFRISCLICQ